MKKGLLAMMVALMATVSVCAQRANRYETENFQRAEELMNEGKLEESLTYFEAELKENPKNAYAHFLMTTVYMDLRRYEEAMLAIDNALKYIPKGHKEIRGITHALKATIHETFQEWEEAIEQLTMCLKVLPKENYRDRAVTYKQRATMYYKLGRYDLGDKDYEKYKELIKETGLDF